MERRKFIKGAGLTGLGLVVSNKLMACKNEEGKTAAANTTSEAIPVKKPVTICTWNFHQASKASWNELKNGASALDAVEKGVMVEEANENNQTVGLGGRPDRDGNVTLDSCIMDSKGNCGSVVYLQNIVHPVSVARKVMEDTPHVMLAGKGAEKFAYEKGFKKENLLTEKSKKEWIEWKKKSKYETIINIENHDTIGMLALDANGDIAGACTTSGMAYKIGGRVGDSPIIGAGLFVDNKVGAATATGVGEEVVKTVGSFLIVELMRQGRTPQEACEEAIGRIVEDNPRIKDFQVGFIALNKKGETGAYCIHPGFSYAKNDSDKTENIPAGSYLKA